MKNNQLCYFLRDYDFASFCAGSTVLDVGCGNGKQLDALVQRGCQAIGIEPRFDLVKNCTARGLQVLQGCAEKLPFPDASFDGVICKGVIPYTVEPVAFREIRRVMKPGGTAQMCYVGFGFYLRYLMLGPAAPLRSRFYGLRTLMNTWLFDITGQLLPRFLGDTVYQSTGQLQKYYAESGFTLLKETPSPTFLGTSVFIYHVLRAEPAPKLTQSERPLGAAALSFQREHHQTPSRHICDFGHRPSHPKHQLALPIRVIASTVALLLISAFAYAQAQSFQHIVVLVQENRTPDNLFYGCKIPKADLRSTGLPVSITYGGGTMGHSHHDYLKELKGQYPSGANNYVVASDIQPYCQLAKQYGFGNYVFQTNQGASLPAHQFLISGSSSPTESSNLFVSDNALPRVVYGSCNAPPDAYVRTIAPDGTYGPRVFPCFTRSSIIDNLRAANLTWKYYAVSSKPSWDGPIAMRNLYESPNNVLDPKQVLKDIQAGRLANVAFVTPTGNNSDHPGKNATGGPSWVASIVNAIGNSQYWSNTAIFVTWDDWGGWWDHVPPTMLRSYAPQYIYGFRVPLLVISAYTPPMVSNIPCDCFGCILKFIEHQFNLGLIGEGRFADAYANDNLLEYFTAEYRAFVPVPARPLTPAELADASDPDDY